MELFMFAANLIFTERARLFFSSGYGLFLLVIVLLIIAVPTAYFQFKKKNSEYETEWLKYLYASDLSDEVYNIINLDFLSAPFRYKIFNKFKFADTIRVGQNSILFRMVSRDTNESHTLKIIEKDKYISHDLEDLMKIDHPNIESIFQKYETDSYFYLVKSYAHGELLYDYIQRSDKYGEESVISITQQLLAALQYLHQLKPVIVYREITPDNIIISKDIKITLMDLDTTKRKTVDMNNNTYYIASKGFAAPELFGLLPPDERTDIYALGATLFFVVTKQIPTVEALDYFEQNPESWPSSKKMLVTIKKCMAFDPAERFQNINEFG